MPLFYFLLLLRPDSDSSHSLFEIGVELGFCVGGVRVVDVVKNSTALPTLVLGAQLDVTKSPLLLIPNFLSVYKHQI